MVSAAGALAFIAGCATTPPSSAPQVPSGAERRAAAPASVKRAARAPARVATPLAELPLVLRLLPPGLPDREGWGLDIYAAMTTLGIERSAENVCAVVAITAQESGFRADPTVPGLAHIAHGELERRRIRAGFPRFMLDAALALRSSDGRRYGERLKNATTERDLSDAFEDFTARVPLAKRFLAGHNPIRTAGPMQVSIAFAQAHAASHRYAYAPAESVRDEVFTRRGGLYFGIAHLLHYPAPYEEALYRFADYNAGRFASRNAAFQRALSEISGVPLVLDGDLLAFTEQAALKLADRLGMTPVAIRKDLESGRSAQFEGTALYAAVFRLAEQVGGAAVPRAVLPDIVLETAKTSRRLTTSGFARQVAERHRACRARATAD